MQYRRVMLLVIVVVVAAITAFKISSAKTGADPIPQQDTIRLENRITQLEQRYYTFETRLRTIEQQSRVGSVSSRTASEEEVTLLRSEIQALGRRLADDECALAKLDERTLPRDVRDTRRRSVASDPCRTQVDIPLRLPDRP